MNLFYISISSLSLELSFFLLKSQVNQSKLISRRIKFKTLRILQSPKSKSPKQCHLSEALQLFASRKISKGLIYILKEVAIIPGSILKNRSPQLHIKIT